MQVVVAPIMNKLNNGTMRTSEVDEVDWLRQCGEFAQLHTQNTSDGKIDFPFAIAISFGLASAIRTKSICTWETGRMNATCFVVAAKFATCA